MFASTPYARATSDDMNETELNKVRSGDARATSRFVREHSPWMFAVAQRYLADAALAEDCVQEALVKALSNIGRFELRGSIRPWLRRITVNTAISFLRARGRDRCSMVEDLDVWANQSHQASDTDASRSPTGEEVIAERQTALFVREQVAALPEAFGAVLRLRDIEGLNTKETGQAMQLSEAAVKVRLHRARAALRALVEPKMGGAALQAYL